MAQKKEKFFVQKHGLGKNMKKESVYKNFYTKILADDLAIAFSVKNISKIPHLHKISFHNTSSATLKKKEELFSSWVAFLILGGGRGRLLYSKRSVSGFKLKEKSLLGCSLNLRGHFLYRFLDLFMVETLPRELSTRSQIWGFRKTWEFSSSLGEFFSPCLVAKDLSPTPVTPFRSPTSLRCCRMQGCFSSSLTRKTLKGLHCKEILEVQIRKKVLSKEFNVGIRERFSFRDLESFFHLFEQLKGFDINFLFSNSLQIFLWDSLPKNDSHYSN